MELRYGPHYLLLIETLGADPKCNEMKYIFFLDETYNFKEINFKFTKKDFNLSEEQLKDLFVLGGIAFLEQSGISDFEKKLKDVWNGFTEVKFRQIKGSGRRKKDLFQIFEDSIIENLLKLLKDSDVLITYSVLNPLYWGLVDIVDSYLDYNAFFQLYRTYFLLFWSKYGVLLMEDFIQNVVKSPKKILQLYTSLQAQLWDQYTLESFFKLKDEFFYLILDNLKEFKSIVEGYRYPNLKNENAKYFIREIYNLYKKSKRKFIYLPDFFDIALKTEDAVFITDNPTLENEKKVILETTIGSYVDYCVRFPNAQINFDNEGWVEEEIAQIKLFSSHDPLFKGCQNVNFLDSTKSILIQASDIIVGLIREISKAAINNLDLNKASDKAISNMKILVNLIDRSEKFCPLLLQAIVPYSYREKYIRFLQRVKNL